MKKDKAKKSEEHDPTSGLYGWITHTELISEDPEATRTWCNEVLNWNFAPSIPTPAGEYHLYNYSNKGGGGIRKAGTEEIAGSIPFVHVKDTEESFTNAIENGAISMLDPETIMKGVRIAIVRAPGGVVIGFSGPSE